MTTRPAAATTGRIGPGQRLARDQRGAVTVLTLLLLPVMVAALALLVEGGSVLISHRKLLDVADAAARAGATALDVEVYRASGGRAVQLEPTLARQVAAAQLRRSRQTGPAAVTATTTTVTVTIRQTHTPLILRWADRELTAVSVAAPQTGITQEVR